MGEWWRSLAGLLGLTFRAAGRQAAAYYLLQVTVEVAILVSMWGFKELLDAAGRGDGAGAAGAAGVIAGFGYLVTIVSRSQFRRATTIIEKTAQQLDEELMATTTGIVGVGHHETPEHADRIALLVEGRRTAVYAGHTLAQAVRSTVQVGGSVLLLARMHPLLAALPVFGLASLIGQMRAQRIFDRSALATAEDARHRQELVGLASSAAAGKELRLFGLAGELVRRHRAVAERIVERRNEDGVHAALLQAAGRLVFSVGYVGAIGLVLREAVAGRATPGDVILAVALAAAINARVAMAADEVGFLSRAVGIGKHLLWLRDQVEEPPTPPTRDGAAPVADRLTTGIEFDKVSFTYPGRAEPALRDVSLTLPAGSVVALVGENGSGKTTLVKLLMRMYDPSAGSITVDGRDIRELEPSQWRAAASAGFQDFCRFEFLVGEAVGVGDVPRMGDGAAVTTALGRAGADRVVDALPAGVATQLGRTWGGVELSGGQWQKLALARALMRAAPLVVVFDEPTASLDPMSEAVLFERFAAAARDRRRRGSVTLLVSHRFSTVRMADHIVVLRAGQVVESGTHAVLMAQGGLYAELYTLQARSLTG